MKRISIILSGLIVLGCSQTNQITDSNLSTKQNDVSVDYHKSKEFTQVDDSTSFQTEVVKELDDIEIIRENFDRINAINNWTSTKRVELMESTEGGKAVYYYSGKILEKIIVQNLGETYQNLTEYYLLDGKLSFVYNKTYLYNRPIYYDSITMIENNDNEVFDFDKSEIVEIRSYFNNQKLIKQIRSENSEVSEGISNEQLRILTEFDRLMELR